MSQESSPLELLPYPYSQLRPLTRGPAELRSEGREPGSALVWSMARGRPAPSLAAVCERPGGLALIIVLPPGDHVISDPKVTHDVHTARPHAILPYHPEPSISDLTQVLRTPPADVGGEVTDYLRWRGLGVDRETAHVIRRIVDLAAELHSVTAVSRGMYLSRRALGRRLMSRGLPVPSHWLQVSRLLRVAIRLQNSDATVSSIAFDHGYPDGFSVSNQMERLIGFRPSEVRVRLGWEWILEAWLRREAEAGGLAPTVTTKVKAPPPMSPGSTDAPSRRSMRARRRAAADREA